jgi:hypothetical protein
MVAPRRRPGGVLTCQVAARSGVPHNVCGYDSVMTCKWECGCICRPVLPAAIRGVGLAQQRRRYLHREDSQGACARPPGTDRSPDGPTIDETAFARMHLSGHKWLCGSDTAVLPAVVVLRAECENRVDDQDRACRGANLLVPVVSARQRSCPHSTTSPAAVARKIRRGSSEEVRQGLALSVVVTCTRGCRCGCR